MTLLQWLARRRARQACARHTGFVTGSGIDPKTLVTPDDGRAWFARHRRDDHPDLPELERKRRRVR